jgi:class 3 adenylate cyclase
MSLISCVTGAWAIYMAGLLPPSKLWAVWFTWWSGDATGVLLFTPLLLAFATGRWQFPAHGKKLVEGILLFIGLILVTGTVFLSWFHTSLLFERSFWVVPFLIWAAVRFQKRVVLTAVMLVGLVALLGTLRGMGPFANTSLNDALLSVQAFVAVNGVTSLLLHAALHERKQIADTLRQSYSNLEGLVAERTEALNRQKLEIEQLVRNILPSEVATELQTNGSAKPKSYEKVSVLFTDFMGFSTLAEKMSAEEVIEELSTCFIGFDFIIEKHQLEKIKTIGDSYMCAGGIHEANVDHPFQIVKAGLEIRDFMKDRNKRRVARGLVPLEVRIGVHVGPIVAGVLGTHKYAYDIWGSTVNIASRMESNGAPGKVNISAATYELIKEKFVCRYRGKVNAKNVGEIDMYFVEHEITTPANRRSLAPSTSI